ncbi:MAG: dTDP-4-dehydrorhamnose reductase [Geobacter sp.]|nr:MAG: dTDP-4-dehydrorhamnose reductase [Geobacter sp.]
MIVVAGARGMLGHDLMELYGSECRGVYHDEMDITSAISVERVLQDLRPKVVINAVAYTDVDGCETNQERAFQVNGEGVLHLARVTAEIGAKLVQISTDYVFDGSKGKPWHEDDRVNPLSVYGRSKLAGEENARFNPDHLIIRAQWLYGLHGKNFVETMLRLAKEKDELSVVHDQVGSPTWTVDLSRAIRALISNDCRGTYHAANGGSCSWCEFAAAIFAESGFDTVVKPITTSELGRPAPRPLYSVLDCEKLQRDTGYLPDSWRQALRNYLEARRP